MPELPEVETVKRVLEPQICGRRVMDVTVHHSQVVAAMTAEDFCRGLCGQSIKKMGRRGKFLLIYFESGCRMILHLRMTGSLLLAPAEDPPEKHTHVVILLDNGQELRYIDQRRFGRFWLIAAGAQDTVSGISRLGIEPFDERLTADYLQALLSKRRKTIKECLLDQSLIAGIGNIYADEILFRTGINPNRRGMDLNTDEVSRLAADIPRALAYYIEKNDISARDYYLGKGDDYRNTPFLQVYGHDGEPCPVCGSILARCTVGGRGSVYCPECQKLISIS